MIKALFFDIDGTLVSFETHRIPDSTVEALAEAKAKGVEIYISTGRPYPLINNIGQISHLVDGYITANGAYCFLGDRQVSLTTIPRGDVDAVVERAKSVGFPCMVVGVKKLTMYNRQSNPAEVDKVSNMINLPQQAELPVQDIIEQGIIQLTPFISPEQEAEVLGDLHGIEYSRWYPTFTDITALGVSKAKGIREFEKYRGFDMQETMAFGDGGNDLTMVREAGVGVAMGNANTILKEAADYITASVDDDGVAKALRHYGVI